MTDEVSCARLESEVVEDLGHGHQIKVLALMGCWVVVFPVLNKLEKLLCSALLKETHQLGAHGFHLGRWNLGDAPISEDVGCGELLELEVACDVGVNEHLCELSVGHEELWDEVNGVVTVPANIGRDSLSGSEPLPKLCEVEGCTLSAVAI